MTIQVQLHEIGAPQKEWLKQDENSILPYVVWWWSVQDWHGDSAPCSHAEIQAPLLHSAIPRVFLHMTQEGLPPYLCLKQQGEERKEGSCLLSLRHCHLGSLYQK